MKYHLANFWKVIPKALSLNKIKLNIILLEVGRNGILDNTQKGIRKQYPIGKEN